MPNAYISGTGFYVPPRVVTNYDLVEQYGIDTTHEWIIKRTGIEERRYAEEGVGTADMGFEAAKEALAEEEAKRRRKEEAAESRAQRARNFAEIDDGDFDMELGQLIVSFRAYRCSDLLARACALFFACV